jgi:hypothetical protein
MAEQSNRFVPSESKQITAIYRRYFMRPVGADGEGADTGDVGLGPAVQHFSAAPAAKSGRQ